MRIRKIRENFLSWDSISGLLNLGLKPFSYKTEKQCFSFDVILMTKWIFIFFSYFLVHASNSSFCDLPNDVIRIKQIVSISLKATKSILETQKIMVYGSPHSQFVSSASQDLSVQLIVATIANI